MHSALSGRFTYGALVLGTIGVGLVVHWHGTALPADVRDIVGDALWAMMIFWVIGAVVPDTSIVTRAVVALGICIIVEASQAYHSQFLDNLRQSRVGHLFLGSGFDPRDLVAYALGVVAALVLEMTARRKRQ